MSLSPEKLHEANIAQLRELNERVRLYASRMWQVPFVYIASTGVTLIKADEANHISVIAVTIIFTIFGFLVLWIINDIIWRINELIKDIKKIEEKLSLDPTIVNQRPIPYYLITCSGILLNLVVFWFFWEPF